MNQKILYGGDYNPEQWLSMPEILEKDIEYMKEAGINTVTMGMFSWAVLEPEEGRYEFGWLKERIDRLYQEGISTILGTPSGARPKWLADKYPEVLRVREDRKKYIFGARHNHCYTSPVYREKVKNIDRALAECFKDHPGVILWHLSNEYGGECHCPLCQKAFRSWLKERYQNIDELNRKWNTTFWSHTYQSFEQIESPSSIGETGLHALTLDWKRFVTAQTADFAQMEAETIRNTGAKQSVTTNLMYDYQGLNYDKLAECVDVISWDTYPVWHKKEDIVIARDNGMQHDYMRCLKKKPFLLMESCPSATNWQSVSKLKKPGMLTAASIQALAHGSDSVLFFQIRQSRGASEKFHGAVIDHYGGNDTRVFREVKKLGEALQKLGEIVGANVKSEIACIYDVENRWALENAQGPRNEGMHYHEIVMKSYNSLKKQGLNVDVISQEHSLEGYRLVVAPMLYMLRKNMQESLRLFVEKGGCVVLTGWSGIVDENDLCYLGGTPGGLMDVFGVRRTETDGLYEWETNSLVPDEKSGFQETYECRYLCDLLKPEEGTEVLYRYGKDFYQGTPAVVKNAYGKGITYYIAADVEESFYEEFYKNLKEELSLSEEVSGRVPHGIEVCSRESEYAKYIFVQNFKAEPADVSEMKLEGDLLYGCLEDGCLEGYGSLILKKQK